MRRSRYYVFGFFALVLGLVALDVYVYQKGLGKQSKGTSKTQDVTTSQKAATQGSPASGSPQNSAISTSKEPAAANATLPSQPGEELSAEFKAQLATELAQVGQIQANAQAVAEIEKRLSSFARHLTTEEIKYLSFLVQTPEITGDLKALALDLLGRNQSSEALTALKEFALQSTEKNGFSPLPMQIRREVEAMQAMAVEELASARTSFEAIRHLEEIRQKTANPFLRDRADRSLLSLKGSVPSVESQDKKALKELLQ